MSRFGSSFLRYLRSPPLSLPVEAFLRGFIGHAFPPHATIWRKRNIRENAVLCESRHGIGVGLWGSTGRDAKKACLRIDGSQPTVFVRPNPGDVIANGPNLPALKPRWGYEHCKIR